MMDSISADTTTICVGPYGGKCAVDERVAWTEYTDEAGSILNVRQRLRMSVSIRGPIIDVRGYGISVSRRWSLDEVGGLLGRGLGCVILENRGNDAIIRCIAALLQCGEA